MGQVSWVPRERLIHVRWLAGLITGFRKWQEPTFPEASRVVIGPGPKVGERFVPGRVPKKFPPRAVPPS
eukprot:16445263-Heterocapsa_arctica.AAC.1